MKSHYFTRIILYCHGSSAAFRCVSRSRGDCNSFAKINNDKKPKTPAIDYLRNVTITINSPVAAAM